MRYISDPDKILEILKKKSSLERTSVFRDDFIILEIDCYGYIDICREYIKHNKNGADLNLHRMVKQAYITLISDVLPNIDKDNININFSLLEFPVGVCRVGISESNSGKILDMGGNSRSRYNSKMALIIDLLECKLDNSSCLDLEYTPCDHKFNKEII